VAGAMEGMGSYKWADGKSYEGLFAHDLKEGFGIFKWPDGRCYKGNWCRGK